MQSVHKATLEQQPTTMGRSVSLLVGLGLNILFGLWWADPLVALLIAAIAAEEGREAWQDAAEPSEHDSGPRPSTDHG